MTRDNKLLNGIIKGKRDIANQLRVEAWLAESKERSPYATAGVDDNGRFSLELVAKQTEETKHPLKPGDRFYFKVFDDAHQLVDTSRFRLWYYEQENPPLEIEVEETEAGSGNDNPPEEEVPAKTKIVQGRVINAEGQPVSGVQVRLFQRSVSGDKLLVKKGIGDNGNYQFEIKASEQTRDFIVRVFNKNKKVGESDPCVEIAQTIIIDIVVGDEPYRGPAEYDRLHERLAPYLEDGTQLADVDSAGIEFLVCKSGIPIRYIRRAVRAAQLAKGSSFHPALLYGMFRVGIPGDSRRLLRQEPERIRQAAQAAIDQHLISQTLQPELEKIESSFIDLAANAYLNPELAPDNGRLNGLLNLAGLDATQKSKIVTQRLTHQGSMNKYWDNLRQDKEIGEEVVATIKLANQVDQLTGHHTPLTESLFTQVRKDTKSGMQPLARWSQEEWLNQLKKSGVPTGTPGRTAKIRQQNYSKAIMNVLETAFPTTALGARLAKMDLPMASKIGEFTEKYPDFEFRQQRLDSYLADNPGIELDDDTLHALKGVERLNKITPDENKASYVAPLLNDKLSSAHKIQQLGQGEFLRRYSDVMGQEEATAIYQSAAFSAGLAQQLFMGYGPAAQNAALPMVADQGAMMQTEVPEWTQLFGSLDSCSCEHCESVYSPAAYLVDVLQFLNDRGALAALEAKRP